MAASELDYALLARCDLIELFGRSWVSTDLSTLDGGHRSTAAMSLIISAKLPLGTAGLIAYPPLQTRSAPWCRSPSPRRGRYSSRQGNR
jgi:hypothetical protein